MTFTINSTDTATNLISTLLYNRSSDLKGLGFTCGTLLGPSPLAGINAGIDAGVSGWNNLSISVYPTTVNAELSSVASIGAAGPLLLSSPLSSVAVAAVVCSVCSRGPTVGKTRTWPCGSSNSAKTI